MVRDDKNSLLDVLSTAAVDAIWRFVLTTFTSFESAADWIFTQKLTVSCQSPILLQTKNTVFLFESFNFVHIFFFRFISTSYDTHLRTRRRQSSVLGKCRSVPPSNFCLILLLRKATVIWPKVYHFCLVSSVCSPAVQATLSSVLHKCHSVTPSIFVNLIQEFYL